tara:strand:- start:499 stop:930 length:432 start_codon:yes stop_codon:yes gene_type:complete
MGSWELRPGLHNVGSFQVSGKPFASGSCLAPASGSTDVLTVDFPNVTKWVQIIPHRDQGGDLKVGFSAAGITSAHTGEACFRIHCGQSGSVNNPLDLKISRLTFQSTTTETVTFDIVAGLTNIPPISVETEDGPSWQGTTGVK